MSGSGFTLVELLVTITIAIILMGIAIPNYRAYVIRANRSDATTALLRIAAAQEKFYIQNNTYTTDLSDDGLGIPGTGKGYYTLTITPAAGGLTAGYTAAAAAKAGERQAGDTKCQTFTVNERGTRGSSPEDIETCWK